MQWRLGPEWGEGALVVANQMVDVTGRVARLYQGDPREFVALRNALARDLVKAGQRDLAERMRSLSRPSTPAWLVNQIYWHERQEYDALLAAGAAAREAQQARLQGVRGSALARALAERDAIVARLAAQAERLAAAGGVTLTAETRLRVRTSLEALALRAGDPQVPHGHLSADVELPGLQALAGLVTDDTVEAPSRAPLTLVSESPARASDRRAREELARTIAEARLEVERVEAERAVACDQAEAAAGAHDAARDHVAAATRALDEARVRLEQAAALESAAATRAREAAGAAAAADERLREVTDRLDVLERELAAMTRPARRSPRAK
jgi:hypothetical protein